MTRPRPAARRSEKQLDLDQVLKLLLEQKLITQHQYQQGLSKLVESRKQNIHPLIIIADFNWKSAGEPPVPLGMERLTKWLADHARMEYLHIDPLRTDFAHLTQYVAYAYASRYTILPVSCDGNRLTIATAEPFVEEWVPELERVLKMQIHRVVANPLDVERYLHEFYGLQYSIQGAGSGEQYQPTKVGNFEQLMELGRRGEDVDAGDQHIVRIVDWLLQYAFQQRASDIHLEPRREIAKIRFRIDGLLHLVHEVPPPVMAAMISRFKLLGRMDVAERRKPQDGRIKTLSPDTGREVEMRLSVMPTAFGEKLVTRIFDPEIIVKSFVQLGFTKRDSEIWTEMVAHPYGIVLVTGPTGSGKTSTLYSAMRHLSRPEINICTIEDPIEIVDENFNQMQVNHLIGVDFASGVRTLLRQDPDIIMVGEIRDQETADVSIQAALTGHLVLSTLHTNDAPSAITRMLNIGVPSYLLNASLIGVVAQRLVRTLCPTCKQTVPMDAGRWQALTYPQTPKAPESMCVPKGCDDCRNTGYLGRAGLYEIMPVGDSLQQLITPESSLSKIRQQAAQEGLRPLRLAGAQKIATGVTSFEEVFNVVMLERAR